MTLRLPSAGSSGSARQVSSYTTASLAPGAAEAGTVNLGKAYELLKVTTTGAARVRLYSTAAARDADAARPSTQDPTGQHGLVAEVITEAGALAVVMAPIPTGANLEAAPTAAAFVSITNLGASAAALTVEFAHLTLEA